jgi:hypothetical protein
MGRVRPRRRIDPPPGYEFDGVEELWFDTEEQALALLGDDVYRSHILSDLESFTESSSRVTLLPEINHRKVNPSTPESKS